MSVAASDPPRRGVPVERVRGEHPTDEAWRADAFAQSRHTRLLDELRAPADEVGEERAERICAEVTREALRDLAPALILLPAAERRRAQVLAAWTLVMFDFARQSGLEGERLTQLNRVEFELEQALGGDPRGQPTTLLMAREEERRSWPREALDEILAAARRRAATPRPATAEAARDEARRLGGALARALAGDAEKGAEEALAGSPAAGLAAALLRLGHLLGLGEALRRGRPQIGRDRLPDDWVRDWGERRGEVDAAIRDECEALRLLLTESGAAAPAPAFRRAAAYARLAGLRLLASIQTLGTGVVESPPSLGAATRIGLLLRSRLLGR